jgi:hypothetical protein
MKQAIQYSIDTLCHNFVEGWALSSNGLCTVEVIVDGLLVGEAVTGLSRSDVAAALPEIPRSAEAGFIYAFRERDFSRPGDASVWLRIKAKEGTVETERVDVPAGPVRQEDLVVRSCMPTGVTQMVIGRSPNLATGDLTSEAGAAAAIGVLEYLVQRGPRPLPGVHRYLGYLRTISEAGTFAAKYFPRINIHPTGEKDITAILTEPTEILSIAHQLFVLADAAIPGVVLEFGCYKGYSTSLLSIACHLLGRHLHVFDSFQGLPATSSNFYRPGEFAGDLMEVQQNIAEFGSPSAVTFHPGFFSDSVPQWSSRPVMCLWMDVDLEKSAVDALRIFPHLDRRGTLFSHECKPESFAPDGRPAPRRSVDEVVGPICDAFAAGGRQAVGRFLSGNTGAFWDAREGAPVLPAQAFERLLKLARQ